MNWHGRIRRWLVVLRWSIAINGPPIPTNRGMVRGGMGAFSQFRDAKA
jgi:hypothetical protein